MQLFSGYKQSQNLSCIKVHVIWGWVIVTFGQLTITGFFKEGNGASLFVQCPTTRLPLHLKLIQNAKGKGEKDYQDKKSRNHHQLPDVWSQNSCLEKAHFLGNYREESEMLAGERMKSEKRSRLSFNFRILTQQQRSSRRREREVKEAHFFLPFLWPSNSPVCIVGKSDFASGNWFLGSIFQSFFV